MRKQIVTNDKSRIKSREKKYKLIHTRDKKYKLMYTQTCSATYTHTVFYVCVKKI